MPFDLVEVAIRQPVFVEELSVHLLDGQEQAVVVALILVGPVGLALSTT